MESSNKPITSKYRGVSWAKQRGKWLSRIRIRGKQVNLGYFADEKHAARAYDNAARKHFDGFAKCNFPV